MNKIFIHKFPRLMALVAMLFVVATTTTMQAQNLRTAYMKYNYKGDIIKAGNVKLYSFKTKAQADRAAELLSSGEGSRVSKLAGFIAESITDMEDGACYIKMTNDGWLVVDPEKLITDDILEVEVISSKPSNNNGDVIYVIGNAKANNGEKTIKMKEVETTGKKSISKAQDMVSPKACGSTLFFAPVRVMVDSIYAHEDARFIVAPVIYKDGEISQTFPPTVLDGKPYHDSQERRMGYDMTNDKLNQYIVNHYMQTHRPDEVRTQAFRVTNFDKTKKYKGIARYSFENYNKVYYEGTYEWWDGRTQDPMRFLDWEDVKKSIPIEVERYRRIGRAERTSASMKGLTVNYPVGSTDMDMTDSITVENIDKIQKSIAQYYGGESLIEKMIIKGFASPEGTFASNERLCRERAASLGQWVRRKYSDTSTLQKITSEGHIATWIDVANYLEEQIGSDYAREIATEVREIATNVSSMDAQYAQIRNKEWYPFVKENVLPGLRKVDVEFVYVTERVKEPIEIREAYQTRGDDYLQVAKPYEFYELLKMYGDTNDLENTEKIAKAAYNAVFEDAVRTDRDVQGHNPDGTINFYLKPSRFYQRNYPLAAYHMVRCKFMRHEVDTVTLNNYIDWSNNGMENERKWAGQKAGWWNDEAIVVLQILMYCEAKDYFRAHDLCRRHLSDDPKFEELKMFVRCMDCEWDNPEVKSYVASTSPLNKAVVTMADGSDETNFKEALRILNTDPDINPEDPNVLYMKAICRFQTEADIKPDAQPFFANNIYIAPEEREETDAKDFAAPMLDVFRVAPRMLQDLDSDGYFNDSYRLLVWYFWKRMKEGLTMEEISKEYNANRARYMTEQAKKKKK